MEKSHAQRMIDAAKVVNNLSPMGDIPASERAARPLASLPPAKQREAWQKAVETAPKGKVSSSLSLRVIPLRGAQRVAG